MKSKIMFKNISMLTTVWLLSACAVMQPQTPYPGPLVRDANGKPQYNQPVVRQNVVPSHNTQPTYIPPYSSLNAGQPLAQPLQTQGVQSSNQIQFPAGSTPNPPGAYTPDSPAVVTPPANVIPPAPPIQSPTDVAIATPSSSTPPPVMDNSQQTSAVQTLLNDAQKAVAAGQLDKAASALERAVRLEPRNASIWHDLAQIRLHQRNYTQAEALAQKSIGLAGSNSGLVKRNWRVIAASKEARGDSAGAAAAQQKAQ